MWNSVERRELITASYKHPKLKGQSHERISTQQCQIKNKMTAFHDERHQEQVKECEKLQPGHHMCSC